MQLEPIAELAARAVAERYVAGRSYLASEIAQDIGLGRSKLQRCLRITYGSYREFLRNITPGMTKTIRCRWCRQLIQANKKNTRTKYCLSCRRRCTKGIIKSRLKRGLPITYYALRQDPGKRWVVLQCEDIWGCPYKAFILKEFGLVLPIASNRVQRRHIPKPKPKKVKKAPKPKPVEEPRVSIEERNKLVVENYPLVLFFAKKFVKRHKMRNMEIEDIIQAGIFGLVRAVEKFDASRGFRFSTYASWWIRQKMDRAYRECNFSVRLPARYDVRNDPGSLAVISSLDSVSELMQAYMGTSSTEGGYDLVECVDILERMGLPEREIDIFYMCALERAHLSDVARKYSLSEERVRQIYAGIKIKVREVVSKHG